MKDMRCRWDENGGADGDKAARTWRKKLGEKNLAARFCVAQSELGEARKLPRAHARFALSAL
jgi:hypothetical protein